MVDRALVEDQLDPDTWTSRRRTTFPAGSRTHFGPDHAHILGNRGIQPATSVHAYSRPAAQRAEEGEIPGAIIIERNVLEWRLDPASPHRIHEVQGHDQLIVILCSDGYTFSLAAAVLQDLGLHRATDLIGGFKAWEAGGLAVTAGPGR